MNYIEQINMFWILDAEHSFNGNESRLYFYLLKLSNSLFWKNPVTNADSYTAEMVGIAVNTLKSVRNRLQQAGLITFKPGGNGSRNKCTYYIIPAPEVVKLINKVSTIDTLSFKTLTPYAIPGLEISDDISKLKQNQTEERGANMNLPSVPEKIDRKEKKKKISIQKLLPPNLEKVENFFSARTKTFWPLETSKQEAGNFFDHYEANGWVQGKGKPIVKWEAAAHKWIRNAQNGEFKTGKGVALPRSTVTKPDEMLISEIEGFYLSHLQGEKGLPKISFNHYDLLKRMGLAKLKPEKQTEIKAKARTIRMEMIMGSNKQSALDLLKAYEKMQEGDQLIEADKENFYHVARRLTVRELFHMKQYAGKQKFFE